MEDLEASLSAVVSLAAMPLANALVTYEELKRGTSTYPLDVVFCGDCSPVQIDEAAGGLAGGQYYSDCGRRVESVRDTRRAEIGEICWQGHQTAADGAVAKRTVLLNCGAVGADQIDFVVDANPHKVGRYVPGVGLPVEPPSKPLQRQADCTLLLLGNIASEVLAQPTECVRRGGRFIRGVPALELL